MLKSTIKYGLMFIVALIVVTQKVSAQQKITEGTLTITYAVDSFRVTKKPVYNDVKISFKDNYLKVNTSYALLNKPKETCMIYQLGQPNILLLTEVSGMKLAVNILENDYRSFSNYSSYGQRKNADRMELLNASIIDFQSVGEMEKISDYQCKKYKAAMPNGEYLTIWTTEDIVLPFNFLNYEIGSISELLKEKKIKGTLLRLQYANKLDATIKLDTKKVEDISMNVPQGYTLFDLNQIMKGLAAKPKGN